MDAIERGGGGLKDAMGGERCLRFEVVDGVDSARVIGGGIGGGKRLKNMGGRRPGWERAGWEKGFMEVETGATPAKVAGKGITGPFVGGTFVGGSGLFRGVGGWRNGALATLEGGGGA